MLSPIILMNFSKIEVILQGQLSRTCGPHYLGIACKAEEELFKKKTTVV